MTFVKIKLLLSLFWLTLSVGNFAVAQETVLEEIIVTATKREQSIQNVPMAVSAIDGDYFSSKGISNLLQLQQAQASLGIYTSTSISNGTSFKIRGIGTTGNNFGLESSVGSFIDGVYRSRAGHLNSNYYDIEHLEVLKGPQGTLFGKGTTAGAINIISKSPEFDYGAGLNLSATTLANDALQNIAVEDIALHQNINFDGYVTGPIIDDLAFRVAVGAQVRDGWIDARRVVDPDGAGSDVIDDSYGNIDRYAIKAQLFYYLTDDLTLKAIVDYRKQDEACCAGGYSTLDSPFNDLLATLRGSGGTASSFDLQDQDRFVTLNSSPKEEVEDYGTSLHLQYSLGELTELIFIGAYREYISKREADIDYSDVDIISPYQQDETFANTSGEIRLNTMIGNFDMLFGLHAYKEILGVEGQASIATQGKFYLNPFVAEILSRLHDVSYAPTRFDIIRGIAFTEDYDVTTTGYALFTHNTWSVDDWEFGLGVRFSDEKKEGTSIINGADVDSSINPAHLCEATSNRNDALLVKVGLRNVLSTVCDNYSWSNVLDEAQWMYNFSVSYRVNDVLNLYGNYSRGYKAGGLNLDREAKSRPPLLREIEGSLGQYTIAYSVHDDRTTFEPEFSDAYELGWKSFSMSSSTLFNGAVFYTKIQDLQLNTYTGTGYVISNIEEANVAGIELELQHLLYDGITLSTSFTWTPLSQYANDLRPTGHIDMNGGVNEDGTTFAQDFSLALEGQRLTHAPEFQLSAGLDVMQPITSSLYVLLGLHASYKSDHNTGSDLDPNKVQQAYALYNAQLGITTKERTFSALLWGTNLTDEVYNLVTIDTFLQPENYTSFYGEPRFIGLTLSVSL